MCIDPSKMFLLFYRVVLYSHLPHHNDTIIKTQWITDTRSDKDTVINDAHRKAQEDFFIKYSTSHFIYKVSKRVTQSLRVRGSWRPNITEIFWPQSYGRRRCVFLVLHGCSTGALAFLTTSPSLPLQLYCLSSTLLASIQIYSPELARRTQLNSPLFNSSALY